MPKPLWECPDCGYQVHDDPIAGDDWNGEERAVGPDCPECEVEMDMVHDGNVAQ